jgi:hypothetical protein
VAEVLPEIRELQGRAQRIRRSIERVVLVSGDAEHEAPDRVRGSAAVVEDVGPRVVSGRHGILTERAEQIVTQRDRQIERPDRMGQRDNNHILMSLWRGVHPFAGDRRMQPSLPRVEARPALRGGRRSLVGDIVRHARKRVHGRNVGTHRARQQPGRDGKILAMRAGQRLARRVRARERRRPVGHCRILVRYA